MTRLRSFRVAALAVLSVVLNACSPPPPTAANDNAPKTAAMNPTVEPAASAAAGAQPAVATYCLGRFLIDVPAGSTLSGGSYKYDFARIELPVAMSREQFQQEIKVLEDKRRSTPHEKDPSLLRAIQRPSEESAVMAYWEKPTTAGGINLDGYKWIDGQRFLFRDEVGASKTEFQEKGMQALGETLSRLRPRADSDIPKDPGYCFAGGFVANAEWENEEVRAEIDIAGHPDAYLTIWFFPLPARKRDKPLLERMGGAIQQLGNMATLVQVLRKGERELAGFEGQEHLSSAPNSGGMRGHSFIWETQGEGTLQDPRISIELSTGHQDAKGNPQKTQLTNEQAMKLWDGIVGSFRLRPVSNVPAKKTSDAGSSVPLGTLVTTGRLCPQTGLWECIDDLPLAGSPGRYIEQGQPMPRVAIWSNANLWQRMKRERPQDRVATIWRLAAYEDEAPGDGAVEADPAAPTLQPAAAAPPPQDQAASKSG